MAPSIEIRSWIKILSRFPARSKEDRTLINDLLRERFDGYVAATDAPTSGLVPELMSLYPDAKVICTVRDPEAWEKSVAGVADASTMWFLRVVLFPLSPMRYFPDYISVLRNQWTHLYDEREPLTTKTYNGHIAWLKKIVPEERLLFFDVRDGWEPLCKALGEPVPDVPFPRINDGEAIDRFAKQIVLRGWVRWFWIVATIGVAAFALMYVDRKGR